MSKANLANAILAAPVSDTATSATLVTGYGATMPVVPFKMTFTPFGQLSTKGNSEIVLVTARSGEVLTIERAKGGTTARSFEAGDIVSNGIYIEQSLAVGDIFMSLRATPESGRIFMDGGTYNKSDYPLLYKLIQDNAAYGTTGGSGGSETFTLADMRERMPFGKSSNSPFTTLGYKAGAKEHTLTVGEMPSHAHTLPTWVNGTTGGTGTAYMRPGSGGFVEQKSGPPWMALSGNSEPHPILNPIIVVNYEVVAG